MTELTPAFFSTTERLDRIVKATLKRNVERPAVDGALFDARALEGPRREALVFLVEQMCFTEATSGKNLAQLAASTPLMPLRAAYAAQMQDERAHADMLRAYLRERLGRERVSAHWANSVGRTLGEAAQLHPMAGVVAVTMSIEYFAAALIDDLVEKLEEPLLRAILEHLRVDESRHKALAAEATRLLAEHGFVSGFWNRACVGAARAGADLWFRRVYAAALRPAADALGLDARGVYERARDEMDVVLREGAAA